MRLPPPCPVGCDRGDAGARDGVRGVVVGGPIAGAGPRVGLVHGSVAGSPPAAQPPDSTEVVGLRSGVLRRDHHAIIDNPWFPIAPGNAVRLREARRWKARTSDPSRHEVHGHGPHEGDRRRSHAVIVWDRDYSGGELVETELALFAQDTAGNVWHFGQVSGGVRGRPVRQGPGLGRRLRRVRRTGITIKANPQIGVARATRRDMRLPPSTGSTARRVYRDGPADVCAVRMLRGRPGRPKSSSKDKPGAFQLKFYASRRRQRQGRMARPQRGGTRDARARRR